MRVLYFRVRDRTMSCIVPGKKRKLDRNNKVLGRLRMFEFCKLPFFVDIQFDRVLSKLCENMWLLETKQSKQNKRK